MGGFVVSLMIAQGYKPYKTHGPICGPKGLVSFPRKVSPKGKKEIYEKELGAQLEACQRLGLSRSYFSSLKYAHPDKYHVMLRLGKGDLVNGYRKWVLIVQARKDEVIRIREELAYVKGRRTVFSLYLGKTKVFMDNKRFNGSSGSLKAVREWGWIAKKYKQWEGTERG